MIKNFSHLNKNNMILLIQQLSQLFTLFKQLDIINRLDLNLNN